MKSCPLPHALDNLTATLRICVNSRLALSAGVHTMRARICSAISCDMFARVVWLKPWERQNRRLSLYSVPHALDTHGSRD